MMERKSIIIIGGGIAGLTAAQELSDDFMVTVLEASKRWGGRIFSCNDENFSSVIEGGAEFIHGDLPFTKDLMKRAGVKQKKAEGKMYRKENGILKEQDEMIQGWDELLDKMKEIKTDTTLLKFFEENFKDEKYSSLRRHAFSYVQGFDLADPEKVSVRSIYKEWSNMEETPARVSGGYGQLIQYLLDECIKRNCRLVNNHPVVQIDWQKGDVTAYVNGRDKYFGQKIIVTTPVSTIQKALQAASINFTPPVDAHVHAAAQIGFGSAVKFVIEFKERFWKDDMHFLFSDEFVPVWWTQLPDKIPMLTGWLGGKPSELFNKGDEDTLKERALLSLSSIFEMKADEIKDNLRAIRIFNWKANPWAMGAYSYSMPDSKKAKELFSRSIDNTIYFCGEGYYDGDSPGTVEASIASAKKVIEAIRNELAN